MRSLNYLISNGVDVEKSLELFGDIKVYNETLVDFFDSANTKLTKLSAYRNNRDMANYAIYVHSLKTDAKYFGLTKLAETAYEHELKSKAGDTDFINTNFDNLVKEVSDSVKLIREYLNGNDEQTPLGDEHIYSKDTILVVDDSNIIRNFTKRIFEETYNVGTATNGQEALDIIEANKNNNFIKAMLLDLNMPKVDGFAVLEYMKKNDLFDKIPVSIISGDSSRETIQKAFTYPIVDMLEKPFNEQTIRTVLQKTLWSKELD